MIIDMKTIAIAKFKEQCLSIIDRLDTEDVVITKHGKPVARLIPIERASAELIGCLRGRIQINGDILSTGEQWESLAEP